MADDDLTERITIRCSLTQKTDLWEKAAKLDRRSLAEWIRLSLDDLAAELIEDAELKEKKRKS